MSTKFASSGQAGQTLYAILWDDDQPWNGSAFEVFNSSNYSTYDIAGTEKGSTGYYVFTFPAGIAAGFYKAMIFRQDGGSPAQGDTVWDGPIDLHWDGTQLISLADIMTSIDAIQAKTDNLPEGIQKNTALSNFEFVMCSSSDHISPATGLTVTAQRSIDGGAFAACANSVTEVGSGVYKINLAGADLNGTVITLKFTATGADATLITVKTEV